MRPPLIQRFFAAAAIAAAMATAGCGGKTSTNDASGAADLGSSGAADVADGCPTQIAACVRILHELKQGCPGNVACTFQFEASARRENFCYENGVRVYADDTGIYTVLKPDGRLCYTVSTQGSSASQIINAVVDPVGTPVLTIYRVLGAGTSTFACGDQQVDIPDAERPCGDTSSLPENLQCTQGACIRP